MADDTPASLATLPVELTTHICTLLLAADPKASLAPLASTSKSLHAAVEPLLYTDVTIEHPEIHLLPLADRLLRSPARAAAVTRLRIAPTGPTPPVADDDLPAWRAKAAVPRDPAASIPRRGWPAAPDLPALLSSALRAAGIPAELHGTLYAAIRYGARPDVLVALLLTLTPNLRVLALGMLGAAPPERLARRVRGSPNHRNRHRVPPAHEAADARAERLLWRPVLALAVARLDGVRALLFGARGVDWDGDGDVVGRSCAALAQLLQLRGLRLVLLAAVAAVPYSAAQEEAKGALVGLPAGSCDARKVLLFECWWLDDACEEALRRACGRLDVLQRVVQGDRAAHGPDVAAAFDDALPLRMEGEWPLRASDDVLEE